MVDVVEGYRDQQIYKRLKEDDRALTAEDVGGNPNGTVPPRPRSRSRASVVIPAEILPSVTQSGAFSQAPIKSRHPTYLTFPSDLDNIHYMQFTSVKFKTGASPSKVTLGTITLPIPANLQNAYAADYEESGLGVAGALLSDQMTSQEFLKGAGDALGDIKEGVSGILKKFDTQTGEDIEAEGGNPNRTFGQKLGDATKSMTNQVMGGGIAAGVTVAGAASIGVLGTAILGSDILGGAMKGGFKKMGFIMNPHLASIFTGVGKKSHNFTYKFIAKSASESTQIQSIIDHFRRNMLPEYKYQKFGLTYPNEWEIGFSAETAPFLYKIKKCVLKTFNVTYNGGGVPVFHSMTNAPVEVDITLGFTETTIETRDDHPQVYI